MIIFKNLKTAYFYFGFNGLLVFLLIVITPIGIRNYIPILFGCATFVIFGINANGYWYKFSKELKDKEPEIFKNNEVPYGYNKGKLVQFTSIFEDDTFKNITDKELYKRYLDLKTYGLLVIYAFFTTFFLALFLIQTKPLF